MTDSPQPPCCHCGREIAECVMFPSSWGHRHAGCRGFSHEPGGEHQCGPEFPGMIAEPDVNPWPTVLPTWGDVTHYVTEAEPVRRRRRRRGAA